MEKIEILDKNTNTKATYVLQEDTEEKEKYNPYIVYTEALLKLLIKLTIKLARFSLYVAISFLKKFIAIVERLFLNDYKPLQMLTETKNNILDKRAKENINKERMRFATEKLTKHTYEFERSELYSSTYKYIQEKLKDFADNNVAINEDIYKDILTKINILTVEVERKALQEGYSYATYTKYKLQDNQVYDDFIEYKIMRGEGHGKVNQNQGASTN